MCHPSPFFHHSCPLAGSPRLIRAWTDTPATQTHGFQLFLESVDTCHNLASFLPPRSLGQPQYMSVPRLQEQMFPNQVASNNRNLPPLSSRGQKSVKSQRWTGPCSPRSCKGPSSLPPQFSGRWLSSLVLWLTAAACYPLPTVTGHSPCPCVSTHPVLLGGLSHG